MAAQTLEIRLVGISVPQNGVHDRAVAASVLTATLLYPNPSTPGRTTVKAVQLPAGQPIDYRQPNPSTGQPYRWADRVLFKDTVEGRTELELQLVTVHKTPKAEKFFAGMFGAMFGAAWTLLTGGIGNVIVGAAATTLGNAHVKSFELEDEQIHALGETAFEMDDTTRGTQRLALTAPKDVWVQRYTLVNGKGVFQRQQVLTKGSPNGWIDVEIQAV